MVDLPVELWHTILQETIALPKFLDVDHIPEVANPLYKYEEDSNKNRNHSEYWAMEKRRSSLRRVCKSWDAYLLQFEHRYVEISDILHYRVPKEALSKAVRIGYRPCKSICSLCYHPEEVLSISFEDEEELSTRIIDDRGNGSLAICDLLISMHVKMPHLQVVLSHDDDSTMSGAWKLSGCSPLKVAELGSFQQWTNTVGKDIVTVSLPTYNQILFTELERCSFPALRDFRVVNLHYISDIISGIFRLLGKIGSNLHSLQLGSNFFYQEMPKELWEVCPQLKRLDSTLYITHPPPDDHPLNTMSFFTPFSRHDNQLQLPFHSDLENFRSMRRLIAQDRWVEIEQELTYYENFGFWFRGLLDACTVQGMTLEDSTGVLVQESSVAYLLKP